MIGIARIRNKCDLVEVIGQTVPTSVLVPEHEIDKFVAKTGIRELVRDIVLEFERYNSVCLGPRLGQSDCVIVFEKTIFLEDENEGECHRRCQDGKDGQLLVVLWQRCCFHKYGNKRDISLRREVGREGEDWDTGMKERVEQEIDWG